MEKSKKKQSIMLLFAFVMLTCTFAQRKTMNLIPLPNKAQIRWHKYEKMMFISYDPCTWQHREYDNHTTSLKRINPEKLDTDQWCEVAKSWGAKMILFVAKHTGGFCWWNTKSVKYNIMNTPYGKDVLAQLSKSCKKYGIDLGIYVYPGDRVFGSPIGSGGITADPQMQKAQNKAFRTQLKEVLTNYGDIAEIWFDGGCKIYIDDILQNYLKTATIFQGKFASVRWSGNEEGKAPYPNWYTLSSKVVGNNPTALESDPDGDAYSPLEMNVTFLNNHGHKWFWAPNKDHMVLSLDQLLELYYKSVGRGSTFSLNCTPDTTGLIPAFHVKRYKEFGQAIHKLFNHPIAKMKGKGKIIELDLNKPQVINQYVLQECIEEGQRVRKYVLETSMDGKKWSKVAVGESVGNKRIEVFTPVKCRFIRVRFTAFKLTPIIDNFAVYYVDREPETISKKNTFVTIGKWDSNTFDSKFWIEKSFDLTKYVNKVGVYEIIFQTFTHEYSKPSALKFKDWSVDIYNRNDSSLVEYKKGHFYITRSQQTLNDFKTIFKVKVKAGEGKSMGTIRMRRILLD